MGLAPLRGGWGRGKGFPRPKRESGGPLRGQRIKRERGQVSLAHLGPWEPAEIPHLILCPPRTLPATRVLRECEGGKGSKSKGQTNGTSTPEGRLGDGRSSYTQRNPPTVRGPAGRGRPSSSCCRMLTRMYGILKTGTDEPRGRAGIKTQM